MKPVLTMLTEPKANISNRFDFWVDFINEAGISVVAELGVWKGEFAESLLQKCASIERYIMVDPWANLPNWNKPFNVEAEMFEQIYAEAMARVDFAKSKLTVLRGCTNEVADQVDDGSLEFVYIDGDHTLRGITLDLINIFSKVQEGGIIAGDDFTVTPWQHSVEFEPTLVCPFAVYFAEAMGVPFIALGNNQFAIVKDHEAGFSFNDVTGHYGDLSLNKLAKKV
ncbi:MAG: class I SAM-dependent methyltransferase [Arenicella sp.]